MTKKKKSGKNQKFRREVREEKVEGIGNNKLFSKNFICDPIKIFLKPIGAVNFRLMR